MKRVLYSSVLTINLFLLCNCSSDSKTENIYVDKLSPNTNAQNTNAGTIENGNIANPPVGGGENSNLVQSNSFLNKKQNRLVDSNTNEEPKTSLIPAPHNSSVATTMSDGGEFIQIRVFNADAKIQKVEKNANTQKVKVFLKNGKILDVAADKTFDFINASPQEILIAVGVMKKADESQTGGKN